MFESIINFYQMMMVKNTSECSNCAIKDQQILQILSDIKKDVSYLNSKIIVLETDNALLKKDNTSLKEDNALLKEGIIQLNSKISVLENDNSLLKEQCLYPKLENVAIQILNFEKRMKPLIKCNIVENGENFITLDGRSFTKTEFKIMYEKLRSNRNDETHPMSGVELKRFVEMSMKLIKQIDFSSVDIQSTLYFSKIIIENDYVVVNHLKDFESSQNA